MPEVYKDPQGLVGVGWGLPTPIMVGGGEGGDWRPPLPQVLKEPFPVNSSVVDCGVDDPPPSGSGRWTRNNGGFTQTTFPEA